MTDRSKMKRTLILCFLAATVDGFDLQAAGIAAPRFSAELGLTITQTATVLTAATVGLFIGAGVGGRLGDRYGRHIVLGAALLVMGVFSACSGVSIDHQQLWASRFLTGLGLGAAVPNIVALAAGAGAAQTRAHRVVIVSAGISVGASCAVVTALLAPPAEWRAIFSMGGVVAFSQLALLIYGRRVFEHTVGPDSEYVGATNDAVVSPAGWSSLFAPGRAVKTGLLWWALFNTTLSLYLLLNWLPIFLAAQRLSPREAVGVTLAFTAGSAAGALSAGLGKIPASSPMWLSIIYGLPIICLFGLIGASTSLQMMTIFAFIIGGALAVAQLLLYAASVSFYPPEFRATGAGAAIAAGRLGAIAGPILGGLVLAQIGVGALIVLVPVLVLAWLALLLLTYKG